MAAGALAPFIAAGLAPAPAQAEVRFTDSYFTNRSESVVCQGSGGTFAVVFDSDCGTGLTGHDPDEFIPFDRLEVGNDTGTGFAVDPQGNLTSNASATFNGGTTFNGGVQFNGQVGFTGIVQAKQINTVNIVNSGTIQTANLNAGFINASGNVKVTGSLTAGSLSAGSTAVVDLSVATNAKVNGTLTVGSKLAVASGATVDMGGNRVQNVGTPVAATDAANKAYVDSTVQGVQSSVSTLSTQVADHETRITAAEAVNTQQNTHLTNIDSHLSTIDATNTQQDSRLSSIEALDAQQGADIHNLQSDVSSLQSDVNGLHRDMRRANGGIAAAVALGGTMVVPDSVVSISFNLATFRGEQGFSGSIVGQIAPKVYVQAGIGGSTVRGTTTGRVGITFGM
ncbi:hypothetical protein [Flavisphingomonas formosensis]|uniref:hypothetical protein n=1 Tax=Flavisphingomonas formosensis TaxID=861534 RepID=UPI0012F869C0|nr:hypothetical protein [Sphingomonas formosensis]